MPTKHNNSINFVHYYGAGTEHIAGGVASLPLRNKVINSTAVIHPATPLTSQQSSPDNREGKPGHYPSSQPLALTTSTAHAPRNRSIFDIEKCPELKEHGKVYRRKLILYSKLIDTENIKPPEFVARYGGKLRATYGLQRRAKEIRDKYIPPANRFASRPEHQGAAAAKRFFETHGARTTTIPTTSPTQVTRELHVMNLIAGEDTAKTDQAGAIAQNNQKNLHAFAKVGTANCGPKELTALLHNKLPGAPTFVMESLYIAYLANLILRQGMNWLLGPLSDYHSHYNCIIMPITEVSCLSSSCEICGLGKQLSFYMRENGALAEFHMAYPHNGAQGYESTLTLLLRSLNQENHNLYSVLSALANGVAEG